MPKPTEDELRSSVCRGGRVFLFSFPDKVPGKPEKGCRLPSSSSQDKIVNALFAIAGCKEVDGPYYNGVMAITIDDTKEGISDISDKAFCDVSNHIIHENWKG